jgi:hypothetical protein
MKSIAHGVENCLNLKNISSIESRGVRSRNRESWSSFRSLDNIKKNLFGSFLSDGQFSQESECPFSPVVYENGFMVPTDPDELKLEKKASLEQSHDFIVDNEPERKQIRVNLTAGASKNKLEMVSTKLSIRLSQVDTDFKEDMLSPRKLALEKKLEEQKRQLQKLGEMISTYKKEAQAIPTELNQYTTGKKSLVNSPSKQRKSTFFSNTVKSKEKNVIGLKLDVEIGLGQIEEIKSDVSNSLSKSQ